MRGLLTVSVPTSRGPLMILIHIWIVPDPALAAGVVVRTDNAQVRMC